MKKTKLLILAMCLSSATYAQLTTRSNDATVEQLGARPQGGDMALTFGFNFSSLFSGRDSTATINTSNSLSPGNLITLRMYKTSDIAYRAGIRLYKDASVNKGTTVDLNGNSIADVENKDSRRQYELMGGYEKHFDAANNFFDAYLAGDGYLGTRRDVEISNAEFSNGDKNNVKRVTSSAIIGIGATIGFNVFVSNLPISLGLEYGWGAKWALGGKTKVEEETVSGSNSTSQEYFLDGNDPTRYSELKKREFQMETNSNFRLVANIYFSRGKK